MTPEDEQDREPVEELAEQVQAATSDSMGLAYVDQVYTGEDAVSGWGIRLEVVNLPAARNGFVLLPRRGCRTR